MSAQSQAEYHKQCLQALYQSQPRSLGAELEKWAAEKPDHTAIIFGDEVITYARFNEMSNRYMALFAYHGFVKGDVVAVVMSSRPQLLMIVAGLSKLGIISALINPEMRGDVLAASINLAEPSAIIIGDELLNLYKTINERIRMHAPSQIWVETKNENIALPDNYRCLIAEQLEDPDILGAIHRPEINSDDVLAYLYTSGSFGPRKAVPILNKRLLAVGHAIAFHGYIDQNTTQYVAVPLYLNSGFNVCWGSMIVTGSTIVLESRFSVSKFWTAVRKWGVNSWVAVGEMCRYLLSKPEQADDAYNPLKFVLCNGMVPQLIEPFRQRFGIERMVEIYGTTEGAGLFFNETELPGICGNIKIFGQPQATVVRCDLSTGEIVRDAEGKIEKCEVGEIGLLLCAINSLNQFIGYINDSEATDSRIVTGVFNDGDQYFNTFDLMELHEGDHISFVDHLGDSYRWRGKTVSAQLVADVIFKFYGSIEDVTVYGVRVPGHEGRCGMAVIRLVEDEKMDWVKFTEHINRRMPEHARPVFIRINQSNDYNEPLDRKSYMFKQEAYSPTLITDPLFYFSIEQNKYLPFTLDTYEAIIDRRVKV